MERQTLHSHHASTGSEDDTVKKHTAEHRASTCTTRSSSLSISTVSSHHNDLIAPHDVDEPEKQLSPHVSRASGPPLSRRATGRSVATNATLDPDFEIDFEEGDTENPREWPFWYKSAIIAVMSYTTLSVVMYSTSYTSGIPGMLLDFHVSSETVLVLGITTYMCGLAVGSVILAPLSEMYGRRPIYLVSLALFVVFVLPCALARNLEAILVTRFFGAFCGSAMIGNSPGTVNDIVSEEYRALAFSIWSLGPMNGPVVGPLVGGFVFQYLGWRWTNWLVMILSGVALAMVVLVKETYAPAILRKKAARRRKETEDSRWWSRYDDKKEFWPLLKLNLSRPFVMTVTEPICMFWGIYIALVYGVLYLCFVAYPIVFSEGRGWSPGIAGLGFVGIGIGSVIAIASEPLIRRIINAHKADPETGQPPPEAMVSVVCVAALLIPAGELIFAWTCTPNVHWVFPILASIPFGAGNALCFIYASNYLVHSYGIYAASALAGNAVLRSLLGGTLPLAAPALYRKLGPHWAGTLLGLLELALVPIPFVFYRYGHRIRRKSALIGQMQRDKDRLEGKRRKAEERAARREEDEAGMRTGSAGAEGRGAVGEKERKDVLEV